MRVIVGLSGGVDSSTSAALLKEQGHDVIGVHLQMVHDIPDSVASGCSSSQDRQDAIRAAATLGIPIHVIDASHVYEKEVMQPFLDAYVRHLTPNPDIWCNERVKFPLLLQAMQELSADRIATGHYAQIHTGEIHRGKDVKKDQSYFLCRVPQDALEVTLFPLGLLEKQEVRAKAESLGLTVAQKKDSVGLCFVGNIDMGAFLRERLCALHGPFIDVHTDRIVGEHDGLPFYTVGQRRGLEGLVGNGPWYVVGKRPQENVVLVSNVHEDPLLYDTESRVHDLHWYTPQSVPWIGDVQIRYQQEPQVATLVSEEGEVTIQFSREQRAVTPGQEVVLYEGARLVGSATVSL